MAKNPHPVPRTVASFFTIALAAFAASPAAQPDYTMRLQQIQNKIVHSVLAGQIDDYISCTLSLAGQSGPTNLADALTLLKSSGRIDIDPGIFTTDLATESADSKGIAAAAAKAIPRGNKTPDEYNRQTREASQALTAAVAANLAPDDVACMMTLLPWQVSADNFGRHVADQYLAFQVVVRNLNPSDQFLLHNVSAAVDGGAFHAGVDKMLVRGSQAHGEFYDRRNFLCRLLEATAGIAVGAASYGSRDLQAGIGVFQALVVPGVEKTFPDRYASQINALNDLAFSSATAYSVVVPPKGSAPFVTFLPAALLAGKTQYKHWPAEQLRAFLEQSYVIVAGVHIQEVHSSAPASIGLDKTPGGRQHKL